MSLAFSASQQLTLPVHGRAELLADYLDDEQRAIRALLEPRQLTPLSPGNYQYEVSGFKVFQLQVQPVVQLQAQREPGRLVLDAIECRLDGLEAVDDFEFTLQSWLAVNDGGLEGEALLGVRVSRPAVLGLIPPRVLEATGRSLLGGILLSMRKRVGKSLLSDFSEWCEDR